MFLVHHVNLLDVTSVALEVLKSSIFPIELFSPCTIEIYGVHQYGNIAGIKTVDNGRNHAIRIVRTPLVDMLKSLWRSKVEVLHIGRIQVADCRCIGFLQLELLVDSDIVGNVDCSEPVAIGCHTQNGSVSIIQFADRDILVADHSCQNLVLCDAVSSIGKHSHKKRHTYGRNHL